MFANIINGLKAGYQKCKNVVQAGALALGMTAAVAHVHTSKVIQATPFATIDLGDVTDGITDLKTALLLAVPTVIGAGLAVAAVFFGGKWVWKLFKRFTS